MNAFFRFYSLVEEQTDIEQLDTRLAVLLDVAHKLCLSISSISKELQKGNGNNGNALENKELLKIPKLVEKLNIFNAFVENKSEFYSSKINRQETPIAELSALIVKQASTSSRLPSNFEIETNLNNNETGENNNTNNNTNDNDEELEEQEEAEIEQEVNVFQILGFGSKNNQNQSNNNSNNIISQNILTSKRKRSTFNANNFTAQWIENNETNDEEINNNNANNNTNSDENNNNSEIEEEKTTTTTNSTNKNKNTSTAKKNKNNENENEKKSKKRKLEPESQTIVLSFQPKK